MDLIIFTALLLGGLYGFQKGFVALAIKPIRRVVRVGMTFGLCLPVSELIYLYLVNPLILRKLKYHTQFIGQIIAIVISFLILTIFGGFILSVISKLLTSLFDIGVLGRVNRILGLICTTVICFVVIWIGCYAFENAEKGDMWNFSGGPIYKLFVSITPFN